MADIDIDNALDYRNLGDDFKGMDNCDIIAGIRC